MIKNSNDIRRMGRNEGKDWWLFNMIDLNNLLKGGDFNSYGDSNYDLFQGDCLEVMDYLIEQGIQIDAIITDPPYGWNQVQLPVSGIRLYLWTRCGRESTN